MIEVEVLVAQEQIRKLKAQYCRFLDTKQWGKWGELFTPDATVGMIGSGDEVKGLLAGREKIVEWVSKQVDKAVTIHHVYAPEIQIESLERASGIWAMEDVVTFADNVKSRFKSLNGFGYYHEIYVAKGARWYINSVRLARLKETIV